MEDDAKLARCAARRFADCPAFKCCRRRRRRRVRVRASLCVRARWHGTFTLGYI